MTTKEEPVAKPRSKNLSKFEATYVSRLIYALALLFIISAAGTIGYHIIEGWNFIEGFYMTLITMTTIGFGETHELSTEGRLFTMGLIIASMVTAGYAFSTIASFIIEGQLNDFIRRRKMGRHIANLQNHIVLCGGGRTGKYIALELYKTHTPFVVIEKNQDVLDSIQYIGDVPYLLADATHDETLLEAGIERASGLVAALGDDKDNVFIVLSARALNSNLRIIARVNEEENEEKLRKAGANDTVSPNAIGGLRMASIMLRPTVVTFLDEMMRVTDQTLRLEEVPLEKATPLVNKTLAQANIGRRTGLLVVAIKTAEGLQFNPGGATLLNSGDVLIVLGTRDQIAELDNVMSGYSKNSTLAEIFQKIEE